MPQPHRAAIPAPGSWTPGTSAPIPDASVVRSALRRLARPVALVEADGAVAAGLDGSITFGDAAAAPRATPSYPLVAFCPALLPEQLGDAGFRKAHGLRYAYAAGAMANAIASEDLVIAMGRAGMLGFFGAAGCSITRIDAAISRVSAALEGRPFGFNLIHSPSEPQHEAAVVELYLRRGVRLVDASAYLDLTLPLVRYRVTGIHADADGRVIVPNAVIAKVSRIEVARRFFSPPPEAMLAELQRRGEINALEAQLAANVPVAQDMTVEADSGGHTDNRPAITLFPTMLALRDQMQKRYAGDGLRLRVGLAGGIATPASVAAAFAMGAAFVMTGSVNQACVEAGTSSLVREMLAQAEQADVTMAPAADMFELGVQVQVLKRGTMFAMRARKLYELYRTHGSLDELPDAQRGMLERDYFRTSLEQAWAATEQYFAQRDPRQLERAARDPKHRMALVFRSYLGQASRWANSGDASRKIDFQIWCGPAMGAFNEWARGSFLEHVENRRAALVASNLMVGGAYLTRVSALRQAGVELSDKIEHFAPCDPATLDEMLAP
ncbi:MAG: Polyketide biosynthesis protein PksE [Phycisphaerae bacterium]|nr:Polyketide biosynthesis protein PksE [Phycisphaerae bacterium]